MKRRVQEARLRSTVRWRKEAYEDKKAAQPKMPEYSDYSSAGGEDFVTDGTQDDGQDLTDQGSVSAASTGSSVDTSGIDNAIERASSDLADLQSDLATQKSIAEADSTSLQRRKKKLRVSNNLTELDAKSAKELVEEGKKASRQILMALFPSLQCSRAR